MAYFSEYFTSLFSNFFGIRAAAEVPEEPTYVELSMQCEIGLYFNTPVAIAGDEVLRMSNFGELKRQVLLRLDKTGGRAALVVEQAINDTLKLIAGVHDFDELRTLDTTNAFTVIGQKMYHIVNDLGLVRPKDIYSIRYMDEGSSRKLTYVPQRELDTKIPYTEISGTGRPNIYTRRGMYIELYPIPDAAMPLYIQHSQWPAVLVYNADETPYLNIDHVIVALATDVALSMLEGMGSSDWLSRAQQLLGRSVREEVERPDRDYIARPFRSSRDESVGEYWKNPFVKGE